MSLFGNRVVRVEDPRLLRGEGRFIADIDLPDAVHATFVRSTVAHAAIADIDIAAAAEMPGVLAVVTAADLGIGPMPQPMPLFDAATDRPLLAAGRVRFVGEPIAAIVSDTPAHGVDAAELVDITYDDLPAVVDIADAAGDTTLLYDGLGTNTVFGMPPTPAEADFAECEVVVELTVDNQRVAPCPMEPRVAAAMWDGARLVQYAGSQGAHPVRDQLAQIYGLEPGDVRVITPDVGGGFGARGFPHAEELLLGALARRVDRPVRWTETRTENMQAMVHGRAQRQHITIGGTREGRITAFRVRAEQDAGAYPHFGAFLPMAGLMMLTGVYDLTNVEFSFSSHVTNTASVAAYRGAGRPEATAALERAVDRFATEIGRDPAEVRRINFLAPFDETHTTPTGMPYDSGNYEGALDRVLDAAGYDDLRAEQQQRRADAGALHMGIGLSSYVEITAIGGPGEPLDEYGSVELQADGSILARTGSSPHGQGHHTTWAMLISDQLGVPMDRITVVYGDTDAVPLGGTTGGSRSTQLAGSAMHDASVRLVDRARELAATLLEAAVDDVVLDAEAGHFHVVGTPALSVTWAELAAAAPEPLAAISEFSQAASSFPFGAHCAVVDVDGETGEVTLRRLVAVDDCGRIVNRLTVEGQVHGGLAQGAAQALLEEVRYDVDGNPLTSNFADYGVISATELPSFERVEMETPTPLNPLGAKGIGEAATIGSTVAVQNAVIDALQHLGVRHIDMPLTAERVWRAIEDQRR